MTTDLAIQITSIRLLQTENLVAWLIQRCAGEGELQTALESIQAAKAIIKRFPAEDGRPRPSAVA